MLKKTGCTLTVLIMMSYATLFLIFPVTALAVCSWDGNTGTVGFPFDYLDVQDCVNDAESMTGDIVIYLPASSVSWSSKVDIDMSTGWENVDNLYILGAGEALTIITDIGSDYSFRTARLFQLNGVAGKGFRLSGMTILCGGSVGPQSGSGLVLVTGDATDVRLDHLTFPDLSNPGNSSYTALSLHSKQGLVDHCTFIVPASSTTWRGNAIKFFGDGDASWEGDSFTPGTAAAWYLERNMARFWKRGNDWWDAYGGARIVTRYNEIHGTTIGGHGNDSGNYAATHTQETYNNTFDQDCDGETCNEGTIGSQAFQCRGGVCIVYNNVVLDAGFKEIAQVVNYRSNPYHEGFATSGSSTTLTDVTQDFTSGEGISSGQRIYNQTDGSYCQITSYTATSVTCSGGLQGGTDNTWQVNDKYMHFYFYNDDMGCDGFGPHDGNVPGYEGWPCKQQVGTTYEGGAYTYKPIYGWNNVLNGALPSGGLVAHHAGSLRSDAYHVRENLTFFNCNDAADCKAKADAIDIPGFGTNSGWLYPGPYTCPHPLAASQDGLTGTCSSDAGFSGYNVAGSLQLSPPKRLRICAEVGW